MKIPKPKNVKVVCDVCGEDWKAHGDKPTLEVCVRLLKAELAKVRGRIQYQQVSGASAQLRSVG